MGLTDRYGRPVGGNNGDRLNAYAEAHQKAHDGIAGWMKEIGRLWGEMQKMVQSIGAAENANADAINGLDENQHKLEIRMAHLENRLNSQVTITEGNDAEPEKAIDKD